MLHGGHDPDDPRFNDDNGGGSSVGEGLPNLTDFEPSIELPSGGKTETIIVSVLNFLTVLGVIAVVVSIAIIGFNVILGSASEKAEWQQKLIGVIIAAVVITSGSVIAKMIISVAEKI